ncbi:MAG: ABC transporter permease [Haloechinothrix sp.]
MPDAVVPITGLLAVVLLVLTAVAVTVTAAGRLGTGRATLLAAVRATLQLAAVSAVITAVLTSGWLTAAFVGLMFLAASFTAARRVTHHRSGFLVAFPISIGVAPALALILGSALVPTTGIAVVPIAGILTGGAMVATSLAGRRALDELDSRRGEYEAALSLGFVERAAALEVCRPSAAQALVPALDQTRTVGLVTLPGAYVGVLLGGASPLEAGAAQILVLIALLAVQSIAVLITIELIARGTIAASPHHRVRG